MFREVFETFDDGVTQSPYEREHGIAERREHLRRVSRMRAGLVFAAGHVADMVEPVLDAPVRARQRQELLGTCPFRGQTGNRVNGLDGLLAPHDPFPRYAADLRHAGPAGCQKRGYRRRGLDLTGFDPAVAFLDGFGASEVRWRRPWRRGGKTA
jgi:hypothetical protein